MNKSVLQIILVISLVAVGSLGFLYLGSAEKESEKKKDKPEARIVEVANVKFKDVNVEIEGNGVVESQRTLDIISEVTARVVFAKNDLKNGTYAAKDEVIIEFDKREAENTLYSLRSDFINSVASVLPELKVENSDIYEKWYNYFTSLGLENTCPDLPMVTNSQEKIKISSKNIFTKYFAVKNQEIIVSRHTIKAPFTGYLKSNGILENSYVSRGQNLFTIHDAQNLEIAVPLLMQEYNLINFSKSPKVRIYGNENADESVTGRILRKDTKLNRNTQTIDVYVLFRNENMRGEFLPGNYVHVDIEGKRFHDVALVPRYLISNENTIYTMEDSVLGKVAIDIITSQGDKAVIAKTIPENTKLVTTILQKPLIGMPIQTSDMAMANEKETADSINTGSLAVK